MAILGIFYTFINKTTFNLHISKSEISSFPYRLLININILITRPGIYAFHAKITTLNLDFNAQMHNINKMCVPSTKGRQLLCTLDILTVNCLLSSLIELSQFLYSVGMIKYKQNHIRIVYLSPHLHFFEELQTGDSLFNKIN